MPDTKTGRNRRSGEWVKVSAYCIKHAEGGYKVARFCPDTPHERFFVSCGDLSLGWFDTSAAAKGAVQKHRRNNG